MEKRTRLESFHMVDPVERRVMLKAAMALGFGFLQNDAASLRPKEGDLIVKAGDPRNTPLTADDIPAGAAQTLAWAMDPVGRVVRNGSRLNQLLLLRLDPARLALETQSRAAAGVVAYTSICTHSGCDVDTWHEGEQLLFCSCHESTFDPKDGGRVVDGPAPRVLPALPLTIVDGKLVVAKPFTAPVGYEKG